MKKTGLSTFISSLFISTMVIALGTSLSAIAQKQKVWLDADTGNEMDDLYAVARALKEPSIDLVGLSSAHYNNPDLLVFEKWNAYDTKGLNTLGDSQRLNEEILEAMGMENISHPKGADRQIGRAWGGEGPRDSPAAQEMIALARSLPEGEKLDILTLGALSNVASAIILAPDILPKIRVYALGARYDLKTKAWSKNEFNIRNDLNAFDYLLDLDGLDFTVMPVEVALPLQFERDATYARLDDKVAIEKMLADRWKEQNPQDKNRVMWDLALVEAYLLPEHCKVLTVNAPPENKSYAVKIFSQIDKEALEADFWKVLKGG